MASRTKPPFEIRLRIGRGSVLSPSAVSLKRLRDVVAGKDASLSRAEAIDLLMESDYPNKHRDLEAVLTNGGEPSWIRHVAAMNLGRLDDLQAEEILIRNARVDDPRVLVGVLRALGQTGGRRALDAVVAVHASGTGLLASAARFAAALIAHRLGIDGHDVPIPREQDYLKPHPAAAHPIQFAPAQQTEAEFCLRALGGDPLGVEFAERPAYQIRCGRDVWMLLLNREFAGQDGPTKLRSRPALLGVVASRNATDRHYSPALVVLTSPGRHGDGGHVLLCRMSGEPTLGGVLQVTEHGARFRLHAVAQPGAVPVEIDGVLRNGQIEVVKALSGTVAQRRSEPIRG